MKLYTVQIGKIGYRLRSGSVGQAVKMAIDAYLGENEEVKSLELSVRATEVPAIEVIQDGTGAAKDPVPAKR